MNPIDVVVVDDHQFLLAGLEALLRPYAGINIVHSYTQVAELKAGLEKGLPDVLLMDLLMPDQPGKELATELLSLYPGLRILVLTSIDAPAMVTTMLRKGCRGYALKDTQPEYLVNAIEAVYRGETYIEPSIKEQFLEHSINYKNNMAGKVNAVPELSIREKEMLKLVAGELSTREISEKLFISSRTVESHRYNLMRKLGVKNAAGLVKVAIQLGLWEDETQGP